MEKYELGEGQVTLEVVKIDSVDWTDTLDNSDHDGNNFEGDNHSVSFSISNINGNTSLASSRQR